MKRPRPYIPLATRRIVARRQLVAKTEGGGIIGLITVHISTDGLPTSQQLPAMLKWLFGDAKVALDHNPALILREFNPRTGKYNPDANDPAFLVYRVVDDHHRKTNVSGDGALRSDTAERVHRRRLEKNRDAREAIRAGRPKRHASKKRSKLRTGKRKWTAGRKLQSRNTFKDRR